MTRRIVLSLFLFLLVAGSASAATAVDDFFLSVEDRSVEIPFSVLFENDDLEPQADWQIVLDAAPANGDLTTGGDGFRYEPMPGFVGLDTLTYHLQSGPSSSNVATVRIHVSPFRAPVVGDWDGDGDIEVGIYKNAPHPYFYLCVQVGAAHQHCPKYSVPDTFVGFLPIAGNWDDDPADEVGLYSPVTGRFYLRDLAPNQALPLDSFKLGTGSKGNLPLAGDWDGDPKGTDTVGVRIATTGNFGLRNTNSNGAYDYLFAMTGSHPDWLPFSNGKFGVGFYDPTTRRVYLRNDLTEGPPQDEFVVLLNDDTLVPMTSTDDPARSEPTYLFYSRAEGHFHLYPNWGNPSVKVVIPIDPDGMN